MDMHSNIRDLHEHREETETFAREHAARGETRPKAAKAVVPVEFGSGWYHDAAVETARREAIETRCHPVHW